MSDLGPEPYSMQKGWEQRPQREKEKDLVIKKPDGLGVQHVLELNRKSSAA